MAGINGLLSNPAFTMGMGLLQHRADPRGTSIPQALLGGLQSSQAAKLEEEERRKKEEQQAQMQALFEQQSQAPVDPRATTGLQAQGLLADTSQSPPASSPASGGDPNQMKMLGLLAQSDPEKAMGLYMQMQQQEAARAQESALYAARKQEEQATWEKRQDIAANNQFRTYQKKKGLDQAIDAQNPGVGINDITPSHYTNESLAKYRKSGDYNDLKRYDAIKLVEMGGVQYNINRVTGENLGPVIGADKTVANIKTTEGAKTTAKAQATAMTGAQVEMAGLESKEELLLNLMNDENFNGAVGPIDQITGRISQGMGFDEGVLGKNAEFAATDLVFQAAERWKGAISEKELELFMKSAPSRGDHPKVWRSWMEKTYKPMKRKVQKIASGQAFGEQSSASGYSAREQELLDRY